MSRRAGHAELCTLHVSEAYRRWGIGQLLVAAYVESARQAS
ncbi:GNAT family N-acetyltransferase [Pseudomonas argentinensis]|nr:GNAT family N-acetyltransferase [Pseudomonas argentinensis]